MYGFFFHLQMYVCGVVCFCSRQAPEVITELQLVAGKVFSFTLIAVRRAALRKLGCGTT